jgi:serine/threonine-protein kinase
VVAVLLVAGLGGADGGAPRPGQIFADDYRIERELGRGAASIVFAATDLNTGEPVAIKWSKLAVEGGEKVSARLQREFVAASRVRHPGIIEMKRLGTAGGHVFLVMELLQGELLTSVIDRGPMDARAAVRLLLPAIEAVAACHDRGVIHRDIKPDNIFVLEPIAGQPPRVKVFDFSLSKVLPDPGEVDLRLTQPGKVLGTPLYMAPEQIGHADRADPRTDVYAFGVVLYRMLTRAYPMMGADYQDHLVRLSQAGPTPITVHRDDLPPGLARVVMRAIDHEPHDRYRDLHALAAALRPYAQTPAPVPRSRWLWGGGAGVALAVLLVGAWQWRRTRR